MNAKVKPIKATKTRREYLTLDELRHTYATLQLFNKTYIYTVYKMLGHKDIKTTQNYANIVDEAKREAADKIKQDMWFDKSIKDKPYEK